jgi:hypothetical protein
MKFTQEGEWMVGTPLLAGAGEDLKAALKCPHPSWQEGPRDIRGGVLTVMERCTTCRFTTRGKYRPAKEGDSA